MRGPPRRYPRSARVNEALREVLADTLERLGGSDARLDLVTVTGVQCDPDLRHAVVFLSSLDEDEAAALEAARVRLQAAVSHELRLKRTPLLRFAADPAVEAGERIEEILRHLPHPDEPDPPSTEPGSTAQ